jgi:ribosomal protein S3
MAKWKHHYFENNSKELPTKIFRSLEIEQYFQKTLTDNNFSLQNYQINFSNSSINILLSVCKLKQTNSKLKKNKRELIKKVYKSTKNHSFKKLPNKIKYLQALKACKIHKTEIKTKKFQSLNGLSHKILKSLKLFTRNNQNIYLTIKEINFVNSNSKQTLETLYKFKNAFFFKEGKKILTPLVTQKNSASLLGKFIATQLKTIKQQNFFFNFLKESLKLTISQEFSKIQGIKILIKGRINNAARSRNYQIKIGRISLISEDSKIDYSESTAYTSNGTIGIKVWISEKK